MPPFIKYTDRTTDASGKYRIFRFVNVACIASATYNEQTKELQITMSDGPDLTPIKGSEAEEAVKVLQSLK